MKFEKEAEKLYTKLIKEETEGKIIYYKKRKVYPILNQDGTMNWFNFITGGSWGKLFVVFLIVVISIGFIFEYHSNLKECSKVMSDYNMKKNLSINYSSLNPLAETLRLSPNLTKLGEVKNNES